MTKLSLIAFYRFFQKNKYMGCHSICKIKKKQLTHKIKCQLSTIKTNFIVQCG